MKSESAPLVDVHVTGRTLSFNGQTEIPRGMFGVYATPLTPERIADWGIEAVRTIAQRPDGTPVRHDVGIVYECFYDRYQPALLLTDPQGWAEKLATLARLYAENAKTAGRACAVEFWNEPYLNWACKPGVNYDGVFYDIENASEGAPACLKGETSPVAGLVWDSPHRVALRGTNGVTDYLATRFAPDAVKPGDAFTWRDKPFTMIERWWTRDSAQPAWWSGPVSREYYHRMLKVFAEPLKRTNPDVKLIAGWGFHLNQDNWSAWEIVHRPLIDFAHEWIDGYDEHHYGGDTRMVGGTYEVAYAYARARYGKSLKFYNTEAGGMMDPERPGVMKPRAEGSPLKRARGAYVYMLRDILQLLAACPDKAASRITHEADQNGGDAFAFRLLKPLRGQLLQTVAVGPVSAVASLNGTNVCVVLFNDAYAESSITLRVESPGTASFKAVTCTTVVDAENGLSLQDRTEPVGAPRWSQPIRLGPKAGMRMVFSLDGEPRNVGAVVRRQFVCSDILTSIAPGGKATFTVEVPSEFVKTAREVHVRLVEDSGLRWRAGDMRWEVNGTPVDSRVSTDYINDLSIPRDVLREHNTITMRCDAAAEKGFRICTISLITTQ